MSTVQEIVTAATRLDPDQFLQLCQELERLEQQLWEAEREQATTELTQKGITEADIDRLILRRRLPPPQKFDTSENCYSVESGK